MGAKVLIRTEKISKIEEKLNINAGDHKCKRIGSLDDLAMAALCARNLIYVRTN